MVHLRRWSNTSRAILNTHCPRTGPSKMLEPCSSSQTFARQMTHFVISSGRSRISRGSSSSWQLTRVSTRTEFVLVAQDWRRPLRVHSKLDWKASSRLFRRRMKRRLLTSESSKSRTMLSGRSRRKTRRRRPRLKRSPVERLNARLPFPLTYCE